MSRVPHENPNTPKKQWLVMLGLTAAAMAISALPMIGFGAHLNFVLWMVATHQMSRSLAVVTILGSLPGWLAYPQEVQGAIWWMVTDVADNGVWAIAAAIADLTAAGCLVGLIVAFRRGVYCHNTRFNRWDNGIKSSLNPS